MTESARKQIAEKMMKERMRSNAPKQEPGEQHGLENDGVGRGAEAGMQAAEGGEEGSVPRHGVVDAGRGHGERHKASEDREQDAG